jgi:hypothetical protein
MVTHVFDATVAERHLYSERYPHIERAHGNLTDGSLLPEDMTDANTHPASVALNSPGGVNFSVNRMDMCDAHRYIRQDITRGRDGCFVGTSRGRLLVGADDVCATRHLASVAGAFQFE